MQIFKKILKSSVVLSVIFLGILTTGIKGATSEGQILIPDGTEDYPAIGFTDDNDGSGSGIYSKAADQLNITLNGTERFAVSNGSVWFFDANTCLWDSNARIHFGTALNETTIYLVGTGILEQRGNANAQTLRIYGTYTDTDNYERLSLSTTIGSGVTIAAETAGTGGDNLNITLTPAGTGAVVPSSDDTVDLGIIGQEFKDGRFDGIIYTDGMNSSLTVSAPYFKADAGGYFYWNASTEIRSPSDGNLLIQNAAEDDFDGLYFGSQTANDIALTFGQGAVPTMTLGAGDGSSVGQLLLPDGTQALPALSFAGDASFGFYKNGNNMRFVRNNAILLQWSDGHFYLKNDAGYLGLGSSVDVRVYRDDAGILAQRNAANAQTMRIYGTYTDSDNYERLSLSTTIGSGVTIAAETAGTGGDNLNIVLTPAGTGAVVPSSDDTVDLGASGLEFKNGYFDGSLQVDGISCNGGIYGNNYIALGTSHQLYWINRTEMRSPEDGGLEIANAAEDRDRVRIYGSTKALTESSATGILTIDCTDGERISGKIIVEIWATDGTDHQCRYQEFGYSAINKGGTITASISAVTEVVTESEGSSTLTCTPTVTDATNKIQINLDATSSLTQSSLDAMWQVYGNGSGGAITAL